MINIQTADWSADHPAIMYSNILSWIVFVSIVLIALALLLYHIWAGPTSWGLMEFMEKVGALLEDSTVTETSEGGFSQKHLIVLPIVFFLRRLLFVLIVIYMETFLGQVMLQLLLTFG